MTCEQCCTIDDLCPKKEKIEIKRVVKPRVIVEEDAYAQDYGYKVLLKLGGRPIQRCERTGVGIRVLVLIDIPSMAIKIECDDLYLYNLLYLHTF